MGVRKNTELENTFRRDKNGPVCEVEQADLHDS